MLLKNAKVVFSDKTIKNCSIHIEEGIIVEAGADILEEDHSEVIDLEGRTVVPGFIDIHIHGIEGRDIINSSQDDMYEVGRSLLRHGVTSYLPTLLTESREKIQKALKTVEEAMKNNEEGSRIMGIHMEGPFFSHEYKGAQNPEFLLGGSMEKYLDIFSSHEELIKIFSLAPEVAGGDLIGYLHERGIVVGVAHTAASSEETAKAIDTGVRHSVHTFNGMRPLHHREPSCVGRVLVDDRVYCEVILDGIHIHPDIFKLICLCKGLDRVILVSDSMDAAGLGDGSYSLGGQEVKVVDGIARTKGGSLAGSTLNLHQAFKNAVNLGGLSLREASMLVSRNPAHHLSLEKLGEIKAGYHADLVILDEDLDIQGVISRGYLYNTEDLEAEMV